VIVITFVPELGNLIPNDQLAWMAYLTTGEIVKALLCLAVARFVPSWKMWMGAAAVWYLTQASDEAMNNNLFTVQHWEYPLLAALLLLTWALERTR
jgi:hypothetical protein